MSSVGSTSSQSTDQVQSTWRFHLFYQLFPREQKQLFEQLIAAGRAKQFIMVLSLPLLFHWEGRGKQQRGQTYLLCSANLKWLAEHKTTPFQRGGEMVSLQSSEITVLCKWQQHETQKEARASGYVTPQSHELQLLQVRRLQLRSEGKNWGLALVLAAMTLTLHPFSKCFFFFLLKCILIPPFQPSSSQDWREWEDDSTMRQIGVLWTTDSVWEPLILWSYISHLKTC